MNIAIYGYGNVGRGVECAVRQNPDMVLTGIYTRRDPESVKTLTGAPVFSADSLSDHKDDTDVVILCGGSAKDLPVMTPKLAEEFCVVDSFDTHAKIPEHFAAVDAAALAGHTTALISGGWDPGLFSLARLYLAAALPDGKDYTFWGRGVSQGHSDAIRQIEGVLDARQYTVPIPEALERVRSGQRPELSTREKHLRECYVVVKEGADKAAIERQIKEMPNYFADYETTVEFIDMEEMKKSHSAMPHGGTVIRTGSTGLVGGNSQRVEFSLTLASNPEFTGSVLAALARAVYKNYCRGSYGCKTIFDMAPADLSPLTGEELRARLL